MRNDSAHQNPQVCLLFLSLGAGAIAHRGPLKRSEQRRKAMQGRAPVVAGCRCVEMTGCVLRRARERGATFQARAQGHDRTPGALPPNAGRPAGGWAAAGRSVQADEKALDLSESSG